MPFFIGGEQGLTYKVIKKMTDNTHMGQERREFIRANGHVKVCYTILSVEIEKIFHEEIEHTVHNISCGGICFEANDSLPPGTLLKMDIKLSDRERPIQAFGKVIWQKKTGEADNTGAAFFWIAEEDRKAIIRYVEQKEAVKKEANQK